MSTPDDEARAAVLDFGQGMIGFWEARLGARLLGLYLIGSLAHGGFNRRYSDIDMAVIAEDGLDEAVIEAMEGEAAALSRACAETVTVLDRPEFFRRPFPAARPDGLSRSACHLERARTPKPGASHP